MKNEIIIACICLFLLLLLVLLLLLLVLRVVGPSSTIFNRYGVLFLQG